MTADGAPTRQAIFERLVAGPAQMRGIFDSDGGWRGLLARFGEAAEA
jgi:hypothetical protein